MTLPEMLKEELLKGRFWNKAWSLVEGCTPVSPGCKNCWLAAMEHRFGRHQDRDCLVNKDGVFTGNVRLRFDRIEIPLRARKPNVYAIWSDLFHDSVSDHFISKAFDIMNRARKHHFIVVTKRPQRAAEYLASWPQWSPMPNVTILVTMEDQQRVDERGPYAAQLSEMGWRVGALCEPLLGPVDLGITCVRCGHLTDAECPGSSDYCNMRPRLKWIITGGESGPGARPVHPDWVRSLRDQAQAAGVPFMFKSWGAYRPTDPIVTGKPSEMIKVQRGDIGDRWLDGRVWTEVPNA